MMVKQMDIFIKAQQGLSPEARVNVRTTRLGPCKVEHGTLHQTLQCVYGFLNQVGCTYEGRSLALDDATTRSVESGYVFSIADSPVVVDIAPHMEFKDGAPESNLFREITAIEFSLVGFGEGRRKRVEGAIKRAFVVN